MVRLKKINVLSAAKTAGIIYGALGLLFIPIFLISGVAALAGAPGSQRWTGGVFILFAFLMPVVYGAVGFVMIAIMTWFYNLIAGKFGGIEFELEQMANLSLGQQSL